MRYACRFSSMRVKRIIVALAIALLACVPGFTAQESFPFIAQVTADRVNVRAGQSQNFEKLCLLESGEEVLVLDKNFGWYKIQLPLRAHMYISDKYVQRLDNLEGEITADRVNVRATASVESSIISQLEKGARVRIVARREGWYAIQPPEQAFGWVAESFLKFKSKDVRAYRPREDIVPAPMENGDAPQALSAPVTVQPKEEPKIVSVTGYLRPCPPSRNAGLSYELVVHNTPAYYVRGLRPMLEDFVRYLVTIEGTLDTQAGTQSQRPVIVVSKIQLVL